MGVEFSSYMKGRTETAGFQGEYGVGEGILT
jgi:hypothetical protein